MIVAHNYIISNAWIMIYHNPNLLCNNCNINILTLGFNFVKLHPLFVLSQVGHNSEFLLYAFFFLSTRLSTTVSSKDIFLYQLHKRKRRYIYLKFGIVPNDG